MPINRYRTLSTQYEVLAQQTANPLLAERYRKLAEGYAGLAEARDRTHPDDVVAAIKPCQPA